MNIKRVNNVLNLLIDEIKVNEQTENNANELNKNKGINVAKSFLNINCSDEKNDYKTFKRDKRVNQETDKKVKSFNEEPTLNEATTLDENNTDDDSINEDEKAALEFYDEKIDDYDEDYVNKKYRFCTKSGNSSLCCCGCFAPVCYQSQRHEYYTNQYRSLFAVNVKINKEKLLEEKEINFAQHKTVNNNKKVDDASETKDKKSENLNNNRVITSGQIKNKKKKKSIKYYAVFCENCDNHIAYFEIKNQIYHFFDVLPD
ncbi:E2F-associated phosphoprotein, putative [Hepatocystis sp. ex Piliocolobus tephrosceles]|nr:E2F-associated phosphoprotein, putative [Hepatocystis sp. ex Piliocolobus tephrosceles]